MNFRKVNNITGWAVFLVAMLTYMFTREARGSLWDCGEFVATAYTLGLPHPPGAPMFTLLGRFFIILFGDNPQTAANAVNFMSAIASAATILFLFWSITHFARKLFGSTEDQLNGRDTFTIMAAGAVGALAYTFSDSFWFSAVEGEVYALSSFFTALVFWAILKWDHADEKAGVDAGARARSDRWIIFLFFMMGLSIGVHILNLLTIPAIVMVYYYRRYTPTLKGSAIAFVIGCIITGIVQVGVIQYSMKAAGLFDVFFVNQLGMPFFAGFAVYFLLLAVLIVWALGFNHKNLNPTKLSIWFILFLTLSFFPFVAVGGMKFFKVLLVAGVGALVGYFFKAGGLKILKLALWCYTFIMLGYFMYFTAIIRSNANPVIDMNNVDNPISLVYYLSREQYGSAPLLYGPHFAAQVDYDENGDPYEYGETRYSKGTDSKTGKDRYIIIGRSKEVRYKSEDKRLFPRIWDASTEQYHAQFYADWLNIGRSRDPQTGRETYEAPTLGQNINWFVTYQNGFMYWRYFMWNFSGKQNDIQGYGNKRDGNWITGISFIDNAMLGDQNMLPDSIKNNKAHNKLFLLPFILGMIGCIYQFFKTRKDWIVSFLLFFLTGLAVVIYLNQPGNQPRERDYAYVGSFYAFAIWIGLAVVAVVRLAREKQDKLTLQNVLIWGGASTFVITALSFTYGSPGGIFTAAIGATALFAIVTLGVVYLTRAISSGGNNGSVLNLSAGLLCLLVPVLMAQQEWDDHDRSHKTLAPDLAKDYLESCAPNAVIFTYGDNDTYPLWYAQEVENVRKDIRIINTSLLGIDWYINQLRYRVNEADSLDVIWTPEQIEGQNREYLFIREDPRIDKNAHYDLYDVMKNNLGKRRENEEGRDAGPDVMPVRKFSLPVDIDLVRKNGTVNANDSNVLSQLLFEIPAGQSAIGRNDMVVLNIIAANQWKRPIYFTSPQAPAGLAFYLRKDGLSYRLVPLGPKQPQQNWLADRMLRQSGAGGTALRDNNQDFMYKNLMEKFGFGGADLDGVYFDEENRRHLLNIRSAYAEAAGNMADAGKKEEANKLLEKAEKGIHTNNLPYAMVSRYSSHNQNGLVYLEAAYKAGNMALADKIRKALRTDMEQQKRYYQSVAGFEGAEVQLNEIMLMVLDGLEKQYGSQPQPQTPAVTPSKETNAGTIKTQAADSGNKQ